MKMTKTFLKGLGFSSYEVKALTEKFGKEPVELIATREGRNTLSTVVEKSSVDLAHLQFSRIWSGTRLYQMMEPFGVPSEAIYRLFLDCEENEGEALNLIEQSPYLIVIKYHAPFPAVDEFARLYLKNSDEDARCQAAVYAVLLLIEKGTEEILDSEFGKRVGQIAGSTALPLDELISLTEMLIEDSDVDQIISAARVLHRKKLILLTTKDSCVYAMRSCYADYEFKSADLIRNMLDDKSISYKRNVREVVTISQAALGAALSSEQVEAVETALKNRISVITGGPGTGKTKTQQVLLEAYRRLSHGKEVILVAPTGQAAKNMEEDTGYPASTIHSALGIFPGETDIRKAKKLNAGLIIVDEASMLDAQMLYMFLSCIMPGTILVFVGDIDQLPSIGAGNVLAELIKCVPVSRLTKIFRQDGDAADIAYNAARIKAGSVQMIESDKFTFIERTSSREIQNAVCDIFTEEADKNGLENLVVLTPLRRNTATGVNQLNTAIRKAYSSETQYLTYKGMRIYKKDKVVFLKNRLGLTNGSIGFVTSIGSDSIECAFGEKKVRLSGSRLSWITPAYAETIHKSQGDEYQTVIVVSDGCHSPTKEMVYTAITRAKDRVIVVGEKSAFEEACKRTSSHRCSLLSTLVKEG